MQNDDLNLWHAYTRRVTPSKPDIRKQPLNASPVLFQSREKPFTKNTVVQPAHKNEPALPINFYALMDQKTERRFRAGHIVPEARIDLHGMTQHKAHAAVEIFLASQISQGHRHL